MTIDKRKNCYSAGILPYTIRNDKIYYLLGRDWRDEGWSDFGGKVEDKDSNNIIKTAIREFYEETMGCVLSECELIKKMDCENVKYIKSVTLNGSPYFMYFLYVHDENYQLYFKKIYDFLFFSNISETKYMEKCELIWIESNEMYTSNKDVKMRNIFKRTLNRFQQNIQDIEKEILREYALKQ